MKPSLKLVLVGVAVVGLVLGVGHCFNSRANEWEARVQVTLAESKNLRSRVIDLQAEAEELRSQAVASAEEAEAREPVIIERIRTLPPAVTPGEIVRDSVITEVVEQSDRWKISYQKERLSHGLTREALRLALVRGDDLEAVLKDRPGRKPWWIPELVIGPFVGSCVPSGTPCAGVGVTLGWKVSL